MKEFISKNRVLISGLLGAVILVIQQYMQAGPLSFKALGLAVFLTVISFLAKEWKGKTATVYGVIGAVLSAVGMQLESGKPLMWSQLFASLLLAALLAFAEGLRSPENRTHIPNSP